MRVATLGPCRYQSPHRVGRYVRPLERIVVNNDEAELRHLICASKPVLCYELAGPRERLFFEPAQTAAAVVTCGGLCPGLNDVIRAIVTTLWHGYGVRRILGLRYGYQGLNPAYGHQPLMLDPDMVDAIHQEGGSVLCSSRGPQDVGVMADFLAANHVNILFTIGGDGTQRGALALTEELARRQVPIAVIGVPKSIDNDISCIEQTFGFDTAVEQSRQVIRSAHVEAAGAPNGVGIVKLMGRQSGFIAAWATLANSVVNLTLVPEVPFQLVGEGNVCEYLEKRLRERHHAVVVVAEGAGQQLFEDEPASRDASGNVVLQDIGVRLRDEFKKHCAKAKLEVNVRYMDPSYQIRSVPTTGSDSVFCLRLGAAAVHAGMAGYTAILIGKWHGSFTHVPMELAIAQRRTIDPEGPLWQSVLETTGQPDWGRCYGI